MNCKSPTIENSTLEKSPFKYTYIQTNPTKKIIQKNTMQLFTGGDERMPLSDFVASNYNSSSLDAGNDDGSMSCFLYRPAVADM